MYCKVKPGRLAERRMRPACGKNKLAHEIYLKFLALYISIGVSRLVGDSGTMQRRAFDVSIVYNILQESMYSSYSLG